MSDLEERVRELEGREQELTAAVEKLWGVLKATFDEGTNLLAPVRIVDQERKVLALIQSTPSGPAFALLDERGRVRVTLAAFSEGQANGLTVHGPSGNPIALLMSQGEGAILHVGNAAGGSHISFHADADAASVVLESPQGQPAITMRVTNDGQGVALLGPDQVVRGLLELRDGTAVLTLGSEQRAEQLKVHMGAAGPTAGLYDERGELLTDLFGENQ